MFHDVRLPIHIERGASGGPSFKTSVITLTSGVEQRNMEWSRSRGEWDISYAIQEKQDYAHIINFFYARRGRAFGFRFKDWSDYEAKDVRIGTGTLVQGTGGTSSLLRRFPLVKRYTDAGGTYERPITRPINSTVRVYVNGVQRTNFNIQAGGYIQFTGGEQDIPPAGSAITASFEFDLPVRFDIDKLDVELEWEGAANIGSIDIVELKEAR